MCVNWPFLLNAIFKPLIVGILLVQKKQNIRKIKMNVANSTQTWMVVKGNVQVFLLHCVHIKL